MRYIVKLSDGTFIRDEVKRGRLKMYTKQPAKAKRFASSNDGQKSAVHWCLQNLDMRTMVSIVDDTFFVPEAFGPVAELLEAQDYADAFDTDLAGVA